MIRFDLTKFDGPEGDYIDTLRERIDEQKDKISQLRVALVHERCKVIMLIEKLQLVANDPNWREKGLQHTYPSYMEQAVIDVMNEFPNLFAEEEAGK